MRAGEVARAIEALRPGAEAALDRVLQAPEWLGLTALLLALVATVLHRHGQRLLNAALLGGGLGAAAFVLLRGGPGADRAAALSLVPGIAAIALFVGGVALGLLSPGWGTACTLAALSGIAGVFAARACKLVPLGVVPAFAGLGLLFGIVNHRRLSLLLPPLLCAPLLVLGAANLWAPNPRGAYLAPLNEVEWVGCAIAVLWVVLLTLSYEREYRAKQRAIAATKRAAEEQARAAAEARKKAYARVTEAANPTRH